MTKASPQDFVANIRNKNLSYFEKRLPTLYQAIKDVELKHTGVNFNTRLGEVDLISEGNSAYGGKGIEFAQEEVNSWEAVYVEGKPIVTMRPPLPGEYESPRLFSEFIDKLIRKSPLELKKVKSYKFRNPAHMIVFMGVGLGLHIQEFLERHQVRNVYIFEKDVEHFAASLYTVDWEQIVEPYLARSGRTLKISIRDVTEEVDVTAAIWNDLIQYCPHFPVSCLFYNHRRSSLYGNVIRKLSKDVKVFLNLWGYYDDEINQLNNGFHNFHNGVNKCPSYKEFQFKSPIAIVGSGPSLDERIDDLRALKEKGVIIVSCGTALKPLYDHNLKPNIHVEIESHRLTLDVLEETIPADWRKDINFFGAAQLHPDCFKLFDKSLAFIKDSASMGAVFCKPEEIIVGTTPTCTNSGLAMALYYQARTVYFIGLDFGFKSLDKHHAGSSVYYDNEADDLVKGSVEYDTERLNKDIGVDGSTIYTTGSYYTAKRRVEVEILRGFHTFGNMDFFNLSSGAKIENTQWLNQEDFRKHIEEINIENSEQELENLFSKKGTTVTKSMLKQAPKVFLGLFNELKQEIPKLVTGHESGVNLASEICTKINLYLEDTIKNKYGNLYYMVRGTFWHFMFTLYTHAWALEESGQSGDFIETWKKDFLEFIEMWPDHVSSILEKDFSEDDPWLSHALTDDVPGLR